LFKPRKGYHRTQPELFPNPPQFCCPGRGLGISCTEIEIHDDGELTVTSMGGVSGILDRGDPPATPPEEKIKMFRLVTEMLHHINMNGWCVQIWRIYICHV
jgi:hypothetical protein